MKQIKEIRLNKEKAEKLVRRLNAKSVFGTIFEDQYPYEFNNHKYMVMITDSGYIKYAK